MKPAILTLLPLFLALTSPSAVAQNGGSGVKGGDAIVCFEPPVLFDGENKFIPYVEGQTLTEAGRQHAVSASTREQYQIDRLGKQSEFWKGIQGAPYDRALEAMMSRFDAYPLFAKKLREINDMLGPFHNGVGFTGLYDVADSGVDWPPVKGCAMVQAVTRDQDLFRFDLTVNKLFDNTVKSAAMQMHEISYYYLSDILQNATTSSSVELLLISALGLEPTVENLGEKFTRYGFLRTPTLSELEETIRGHADAVIKDFEQMDSAIATQAQIDCPSGNASDPGWSNYVAPTGGLLPVSPLLPGLPMPPMLSPLPPALGNPNNPPPPADPVVVPVRLVADDLSKWVSSEIQNPAPNPFPGLLGAQASGPISAPSYVYPKMLLPKQVYRAAQALDRVVRKIAAENNYRSREMPLVNFASSAKCSYLGEHLTGEQRTRIEVAVRALLETLR